ncbi:hypothetical protein B9Z55_027865 [Caenorhabditis nigoni]|uniref:HMG box domain-containing protein n=1 Tax=Caenorhabditis nigoni TaxID=1611254 RepID=A0A2G5SE60_9PELO|nr:hypothetical protein B9Z55_027865 [Caenorhabditis nigoni]
MSFQAESGPLHYCPDEQSSYPQKTPTAFGLYAENMHQKVQEEHPDLTEEELEMELKALRDKLSNDEKIIYGKELKKMRSAERPVNAYIFWCKEYRSEFAILDKSLAGSEVTKLLAEQWNSSTDEEKEPYKAMEEESKAIYKKKWGSVENVKREKRIRRRFGQSANRKVKKVQLQNPSYKQRTRTLTVDSNWSSFSDDVFSADLIDIEPTLMINGDYPWNEDFEDLGVDSMEI